MSSQNQTYDALLVLEDGGAAVTATGVGEVSSVDKVIDLGGGGYWGANANAAGLLGAAEVGNAEVIFDIVSSDDTTGDETYVLTLELSVDLAFTVPFTMDTVTVVAGEAGTRHVRRMNNEDNDTVYRYARVKHTLAGTTPILMYVARLAKH